MVLLFLGAFLDDLLGMVSLDLFLTNDPEFDFLLDLFVLLLLRIGFGWLWRWPRLLFVVWMGGILRCFEEVTEELFSCC